MNKCGLCGAEFKSFVKPMCESELKKDEEMIDFMNDNHYDYSDLYQVKASMKRCYEHIEKLVEVDVLNHELPDRIRKEKCVIPYLKIKLYQKEYKKLESIYWELKNNDNE